MDAGLEPRLPSRFGYAEVFEQWSVADIQDMVRRDRNHPCVILWSIGNEIDYANDPFTHPVLGDEYQPANPPARGSRHLRRSRSIAAVQSLDSHAPGHRSTRQPAMSEAVGLPELLDAVGYNYQEPRYAADHKKFPAADHLWQRKQPSVRRLDGGAGQRIRGRPVSLDGH